MEDYKYNHEIHDAAKKIIEVNKYKADCLEAKICPKCGGELDKKTDDHGFVDMTCKGCGALYYG